jgi:hypothetical protein
MMRLRVDEKDRATHTNCTDGLCTSSQLAAKWDAQRIHGQDECGKTLNAAARLPALAAIFLRQKVQP